MLKEEIKKFADNTLFSVTFIKTKGGLRTMVCRTGVHKYLNPNSVGLTENQKKAKDEYNLLTVYDNEVITKAERENIPPDQWWTLRPYRNIPCDNILEVRGRGMRIHRPDLKSEFKLEECI